MAYFNLIGSDSAALVSEHIKESIDLGNRVIYLTQDNEPSREEFPDKNLIILNYRDQDFRWVLDQAIHCSPDEIVIEISDYSKEFKKSDLQYLIKTGHSATVYDKDKNIEELVIEYLS